MASDPSSSGNGDGTNQPEGKRMTPEQHALVHDSYAKIVPIAPEFAGWFYDRLFEIDPATKPLFMGDMAAQGHKLMATLGAVVEAIDHLETIVPAVRKLGLQHKEYGVQPRSTTPSPRRCCGRCSARWATISPRRPNAPGPTPITSWPPP